VSVHAMVADFSAGQSVAAGTGVLLAILLVALLVWRSRRGAARRIQLGRWGWQRVGLRVRAVLLPFGPRRDTVRMRLAVHDGVAQTRRVLRPRAASDGMPRALMELLPHLESLAAALDSQLRLWQTEPDRALALAEVPALLGRGHTIIAQALTLRASALPLIDEAERVARAGAEDDLRQRLDGLHDGTVPASRLVGAPHRTAQSMKPPGAIAPRA